MQYLKYYILLLLVLIYFKTSIAQNITATWKVIDAEKETPIIAANVEVVGAAVYCFTNGKGVFSLSLPSGNYSIHITCLGYQETTLNIHHNFSIDSVRLVKLQAMNLALNEIIVTAEQGDELATSSKINRIALDHVQPISLADVMQLIPGNLIENPDMSTPQQIKIREISSDANSALGTAIIMDGVPLNNDANLQNITTADMLSSNDKPKGNVAMKFSSTSGSGVDLRQFSTNNIESIEVISGVPSVQYGNITSGVVIVNTKAGKTPLELKYKTDPFIHQVSIGKGIQLKDNAGAVNVSLDYLTSYADVLHKYKGYDRLNGQLGYYKVFMPNTTPLTFKANVNVHSTLDNGRTDLDVMVENEVYRSSKQGVNASIKGTWHLDKPLITELKYTFSGSFAKQESYQKNYRTGALKGISTALEPGENYGIILPAESLTESWVKGKPYQFFGQISAHKRHRVGRRSNNTIRLGTDYRISGNNGLGQVYDMKNPPYILTNALRPMSYKDIPSVNTLAFYIEDKIDLKIGSTRLEVQAGVRLNNFQSSSLFSSTIGFFTEPRGNLRYTIIQNNNKRIKHLSLRAGAGKLYKIPPLVMLYPNKAYVDLLSLQHNPTDEKTQTLVYTTFVFDSKNPSLKPMENNKLELGLDFTIGRIKGVVTVFKEKSKNGVGFWKHYEFLEYKKYDSSTVPDGEVPDVSTLPYSTHSAIAQTNVPTNFKSTTKQGVEYVFDFNKIPAISTQFVLDGAWLRTSRIFNSKPYEEYPNATNAEVSPWVAMYPAGGGKVEERLSSTLRMITHIPKLAMVFTSSVQVVWYDKYYFPYYEKIPMYLFNKTERIPFTQEMKEDPEYRNYVEEYSDLYFIQETLPTLVMVNFKLSKEIGKAIKLSFYANNFMNNRPVYQLKRSGQTIRRNPPIYFGADIQFHL